MIKFMNIDLKFQSGYDYCPHNPCIMKPTPSDGAKPVSYPRPCDRPPNDTVSPPGPRQGWWLSKVSPDPEGDERPLPLTWGGGETVPDNLLGKLLAQRGSCVEATHPGCRPAVFLP